MDLPLFLLLEQTKIVSLTILFVIIIIIITIIIRWIVEDAVWASEGIFA